MFHAVKSLYNNVKCAVKVNDVTPTLFAIYINELAEVIKALNCSIEISDSLSFSSTQMTLFYLHQQNNRYSLC